MKAFSNKYLSPNRAAYVIAALAILGLLLSAMLAVRYRNTPILGFHAFRQTQTALTSYWACREGFSTAYWTPVSGYPWSIPFEFPIYQWIVAAIACPLGFALDPVGRLVSYAFWIACLWPARVICLRLFANRTSLYFWTFTALFISAPIYLFWGRAFLMETAALFFSLTFIAFSLEQLLGRDRWSDAILTGLFFALAILQKSTTVLPLILFAGAYLWHARMDIWEARGRSKMLWKGVIAYVIPFAVGVAWVKYSDHVKAANVMGSMLTSSGTLLWNLGTFSARFSKGLWVDVIWHRVMQTNSGDGVGALAILAALVLAPARRTVILAAVGLFLLFFMVFENLLFVHDYYPVSNTVYLIFAVSVSISALIDRSYPTAPIAMLAVAAIVVLNLHTFFAGWSFAEERHPYYDTNPVLAVSKFIREHTSPDDPILIYGEDWSSEIPYYGQRRAFVVPKWFPQYLEPLDAPEKYLDRGTGAILVCGDARHATGIMRKIRTIYRGWPKAGFEQCDIYLRGG